MTNVFESLGLGHLDWFGKAEVLDQLNREFEELPRPPISPEFLAELERRAEQARLHPENSLLWDDVYAELMEECSQ